MSASSLTLLKNSFNTQKYSNRSLLEYDRRGDFGHEIENTNS